MTGDLIAAAVRDVLHAVPADRDDPWPDDLCERCGVPDGDALAVMAHPVHRGTIRAHRDCGEAAGYVPEIPDGCPLGFACLSCRTPAPACDMDDGCGAREGEPCEPGCPSLAADPNVLTVSVVDTEAGPMCLTRCAVCTAEARFPVLEADAARRLVLEHREHVRDSGPLDRS